VQNARYEIGEKEKHFFTIDWNMITKRVKIERDGVIAANELRWYSPLAKKFQFDIGSPEPHHVEITVEPFHPIELMVDGKPVHPLL
jgi:hypothetical protein